ncbi:TGF-beta-activated kinase 1 and MAP3K7-binding protein 3 isoform X2 [Phlebotomus papatasi]|uniref:TGF-beta-activated kinase 1 and MAP3K7-binding protein 3 isoform X2 n=1 Tax=Phlebotomus papatasi TaxID=29031 RepID=UPI0024834D37|nr:TGF-beta-activated kinase 1 and MAP3K7-binding protein 3 isoform X2 [Phlebotomus papatasi]XP_055704844.1 TGF-beta-activated kinase 1 and MAP3K7-binding protein 3 isoform X2 [Phlebotomus papatasi]
MESSGRKDVSQCASSIRTKQLFHEMKQKFPTASDDVVNECVLRNGDRATCVALLQRHVEATQAQLVPGHLPPRPPPPPRPPISPTIHITERSYAEAPSSTPTPPAGSPSDTLTALSRQTSRFATEITIPPREPREAFESPDEHTPTTTPKAPRRYTSVKFNLKDFSQDPDSAGDGSVELLQATNITYSSSSLNSEQGYQSRLHINVGRNGGVISAVRTRPTHNVQALAPLEPPSPPLPPPTHSPIPEDRSVNNQLRIKSALQNEFMNDQKRLVKMQRSLEILREPFSAESSQRVLQEITQLRCDCERMARAVEKYGPYGQKLPAQVRRSRSTRISQSTSQSVINHHLQVLSGRPNGLSMGTQDGTWTCCMCTFGNHPLMDNCEQCDMPRFNSAAPTHSTHVFQMAGFNSSYHESVNGSLL